MRRDVPRSPIHPPPELRLRPPRHVFHNNLHPRTRTNPERNRFRLHDPHPYRPIRRTNLARTTQSLPKPKNRQIHPNAQPHPRNFVPRISTIKPKAGRSKPRPYKANFVERRGLRLQIPIHDRRKQDAYIAQQPPLATQLLRTHNPHHQKPRPTPPIHRRKPSQMAHRRRKPLTTQLKSPVVGAGLAPPDNCGVPRSRATYITCSPTDAVFRPTCTSFSPQITVD